MADMVSELHKYELKSNKRHEIIGLTELLIECIGNGDFETYKRLCDCNLTAFEPESMGNLIEGVDYHKFSFDNLLSKKKPMKIRVINPVVKLLGDEGACIAYIRLTQYLEPDGRVCVSQTEETRVWQKRENKWINVHVHRSGDEKKMISI